MSQESVGVSFETEAILYLHRHFERLGHRPRPTATPEAALTLRAHRLVRRCSLRKSEQGESGRKLSQVSLVGLVFVN